MHRLQSGIVASDLVNHDDAARTEGWAQSALIDRQYINREPFLCEAEGKNNVIPLLCYVYASRCYSCKQIAMWVHNTCVFPSPNDASVEPNSDMNPDIQRDFREAARIVNTSPRGAAALLRLAIQKLLRQAGESGENINQDIKNLVHKGLNPVIQQALDVVRVIGNEAVHPGQIDLQDDRPTAIKLFGLVNLIAESMISQPLKVAEMFGNLPQDKLKGIETRDNGKS